MDNQDKQRLVQQYVERQKAYLPTYTAERLWNECQATPARDLRSDQFGFDTPVLRPRVPVNRAPQSRLGQQAGPSQSRTRDAPSQDRAPVEAPSETQDPSLKDKDKAKRKKASTPVDTDSERAARLADRRERKRKKRAIVNPQQKHDEDCVPTAAPKKGRANGQKAKKAAGLALLYGFSATNVTKDRLTLKPAPSLGVFNKGKASTKKKVTATKKSTNTGVFSESAFLNKPSERAADHSKVDDDGSVSNDSTAQARRITTKDRGECTETTTLKTPRATAESEIWDIELQSQLPSSARDVSSEPGANDSAPIVLGLRGAEWSASLEKHEECYRMSGPSVVRSSLLARPEQHDELGVPHAADVSSIHPSHSASQIGRRAADTQRSDPRLMTSKYFADPDAVSVPLLAEPPQMSTSNDSRDVLELRVPNQDAQDAAMQMMASPINSLISAAQPMIEFRTRYDMVPLDFSSDITPYDDCYASVDVPLGPLAAQDYEYSGLAEDDVEYVPMEDFEGSDPLAPEFEDDVELISAVEYDPEEGQPWFCGDEFSVYEGDDVEGVAEFLEGRALLFGTPEWPRLSGLAQAEMDVASRLRDHWRPLRLS